MPDLAGPTLVGAGPAHALDARRAVLAQLLVALVLRGIGRAQVLDPVIELIAVDVVQHWHGVIAVHDPDQAVGHVFAVVDANAGVTTIAHTPCLFTVAGPPEQLAVSILKQGVK